jgi:hypothetical protein
MQRITTVDEDIGSFKALDVIKFAQRLGVFESVNTTSVMSGSYIF